MIDFVDSSHLRFRQPSLGKGDEPLFLEKGRSTSRLLLTVGRAVFELEKHVKKAGVERLEIGVERGANPKHLSRVLRTPLERFVRYVLLSDTRVSFFSCPTPFQTHAPSELDSSDAVCLFSGGVDSVSGLLSAKRHYRSLSATFVAHAHQGRIVRIVRRIGSTLDKSLPLFEIPAPKVDITGYAQSRGLLYLLSGAAVAAALGARRLIVTECGPTMFQPRYTAADQVTMTTHPFVLSRAAELIQGLSSKPVALVTPFANLTKAEVMAVCPRPDLFPQTHSCVSQRLLLQDGTCHGCVIRRLAALAAGVPDAQYARDPLTDDEANAGNLLTVLDFSEKVLTAKGDLERHTQLFIETHSNWDLFERFALDNFTAISVLRSRRSRVTRPVLRIYDRVRRRLGGVNAFRSRRDHLRSLVEGGDWSPLS